MSASAWAIAALLALGQVIAGTAAAQAPQPARPARIAFVMTSSSDDAATRAAVDAFRAGMTELGQGEGSSYQIDASYAQGQLDRLPELVAQAIRSGADVLVLSSYPGIRAGKQATATLPIVGFSCGLELLVDSLARPGGNVTGVTCQSAELAAKQLQLLRETLPRVKRVAVLFNPASPYSEPTLRELHRAGDILGTRVTEIALRSPVEFDSAVAQIQQAGAEAVFLAPDAMLYAHRARLVGLLLAHRLPVMGFFREFTDTGALLSYSSSRAERYHRMAWYVDRILKGAKPADLPVEQPTKFELVINLKTAKTLGLTIPRSLLLRADEVIE